MKSYSTLKDVWKTMFPSAILLYGSYFLFSYFSVYTAGIMGEFIDLILINNFTSAKMMLGQMGSILFLSIIIMPIIDLIANIIYFKQGLKYDKKIIEEFFGKSYDKIKKFSVGQASSRLASDPVAFRTSIVISPIRCFAYITVILITCTLMLKINMVIAILMFIFIIISLISTFYFTNKIAYYTECNKKYEENLRSDTIDLISHRNMFKSYDMNDKVINMFSNKFTKHYEDIAQKNILVNSKIDFLKETILLISVGLLLFVSIYYLNKGEITTGKIIVMYSYMITIKSLLSQVIGFIKDFAQIENSIDRIEELISDVEVLKGEEIPMIWNEISVKDIKFCYKNKEDIFTKFNCKIKQNKLMQLIGDNGAGKTTFINILAGIYSISDGEIMLNGTNIEKYNKSMWWDQITIMNQFPDILPGTIFENVKIAKLDSDDKDVERVLKYVGLENMSDRILIGSSDELSGGEKKRISLARLLLRNTPIIILDEPYEDLDSVGREAINRVLTDENKTRIFISHSNIMNLQHKEVIQIRNCN